MTDFREYNQSIREAAMSYGAKGLHIVPMFSIGAEGRCTCGTDCGKDAGKHSKYKWRKAATNDLKQIEAWFPIEGPPQNIALVCGAVSGVTVLDIDGAIGLTTWLMLTQEHGEPNTRKARTGSGGYHILFKYNAAFKTKTGLYGPDSKIDCRNDGGYIIAPPSRHRLGNPYAWVQEGELADLPAHLVPQETRGRKDKLNSDRSVYSEEEAEAMIMATSPDDRDWWREGGIILGRMCNRSQRGWEIYVLWAGQYAGKKGRGHDKIMHECYYIESQKPAKGKALSVGTLIKKAKEGGWVPSSILELNKTYAVVWIGGDCKILREHTNPDTNRMDVSFASPNAVKLFHAHEPLVLVGEKWVHKVDQWLSDPAHRRYEGLTFFPGPTPEGYYNFWQGFAVEPREGDCSKMLAHINEVIAAGNEEHAEYLRAWLANVVQHPTFRPGVAVVLRGGQGIGKGEFAKHFGSLFTPHYVHLTDRRHLIGHFNSLLKDTVVVFADEAFWAGDKQGEGTLKGLITEPVHQIELKGIDAVQVRNYIHLIVASNSEWVVPAGPDARRFFVLDVAEDKKGDYPYFKALNEQMDNGGREAFLYYLQHYDGSAVDLRRVPKTEALMDQKLHSMTPVEKWWAQCLKEGKVDEGTVWQDKAELQVSARDLYGHYNHHAWKAGVTRKGTEMELTKALRGLVPGLTRDRWYVTISQQSVQVRGWRFPPLAECRTAFDARMNCTTDWKEADE